MKFKKGDRVKHDFSGELGVVKDVVSKKKEQYNVLVQWENARVFIDWYDQDVLVAAE